MASERSPQRRRLVMEVGGLFALATAILAGAYQLRSIAFVERNLSVLASVLFLYLPAAQLWRNGKSLDEYGFTLSRGWRSVGWFLVSAAVVFPLFSLGYWIFSRILCPKLQLPVWLAICGAAVEPRLRLPPQLWQVALGQLLVVALPEEFFFRGYVQGRLQESLRPAQAVLITAVLFALGHVLVSYQLNTLAVFFPGLLFGLLRLWSGSILAGTLFHASCNLLIDILHRSLG